MSRPSSSLVVRFAIYAVALTITACGALETTGPGTSSQNETPSGVSTTSDSNATYSATNTNEVVNNTNMTTSPNTVVNMNTTTSGNGNTMNANVVLNCNQTWNNYAKAFFTNNCADCHSHNHTNLENYATVQGKSLEIQTYISSRAMPENATLSGQDYNSILNWIACKMPD